MEREQLYAIVIIVGVIFSILTNVALYYYGEYRTLRKKYESGEDLHVKIDDFIERHNQKIQEKRISRLEERLDDFVSTEIDNRNALKNDLFVMRQEVDLIKFAKGINQDGFVDRVKSLEDKVLKNVYRLNKIESDEDIVRREFLFGKLRELDRRIVKVEDELKKWMGVSDDKA